MSKETSHGYERHGSLPVTFMGVEYPTNFHIFQEHWNSEPKDNQVVGFVEKGGDLVWIREADGRASLHHVAKKRV